MRVTFKEPSNMEAVFQVQPSLVMTINQNGYRYLMPGNMKINEDKLPIKEL